MTKPLRDETGRFKGQCKEMAEAPSHKGNIVQMRCIMPEGHKGQAHLFRLPQYGNNKPTLGKFLLHCFGVGFGLGIFTALIAAGLHAPAPIAFNFGVASFLLGTPVYMIARHIIDHFKFEE
jgi:hypothetical protein